MEISPTSDFADLLMELHNNALLQSMHIIILLFILYSLFSILINLLIDKLCLFLLENCQLPTAFGLIEKYPTLDLFSEKLTEFLTDNSIDYNLVI